MVNKTSVFNEIYQFTNNIKMYTCRQNMPVTTYIGVIYNSTYLSYLVDNIICSVINP